MSNELELRSDQSLLAPENFEHSWRMAKMIASSAFAPKAFQGKPSEILIAMEYGRVVGLSPLPAIQNIAVINGKPSLYADGLLGVCRGHPAFEDMTEVPIMKGDAIVGYECTVKRKNQTPTVSRFTIRDAEVAGLWNRNPVWKQYPSRMLKMRARAFALRDAFADALGGMIMAEEAQDYIEKDITPKATPQSIQESLKQLIDKGSEEQIEMPVVEERPTPTVSLDELQAIRDLIAEHKIPVPRVKECLAKLDVNHIEHLMSEQVEPLINDLMDGL